MRRWAKYLLNAFRNILLFFVVVRCAVLRYDIRVLIDPAEEEGVEGRLDSLVSQTVAVVLDLVEEPPSVNRGYDCATQLLSHQRSKDRVLTAPGVMFRLGHLWCCWWWVQEGKRWANRGLLDTQSYIGDGGAWAWLVRCQPSTRI